jgi:hypothetical protein
MLATPMPATARGLPDGEWSQFQTISVPRALPMRQNEATAAPHGSRPFEISFQTLI